MCIRDRDRSLFLEAVQCYQIGSHRAAVILAWCATADCLKRRIDDLATEGDAQAQQSQADLGAVHGQACYEENLIACARKCELLDDFDEKSLRFARDTRSQCAHPTGVIPSAEAVRHILHVCTQNVLCRRGYRGASFIRDLVNVQFDDKHFLPNDNKVQEHCHTIVQKVPVRLWSQFARIAAQVRPGPPAEVWQKNAIAFFRVLIASADDAVATHIAAALQGFEAASPDFFALLVGIDRRVAQFWDAQKRAQARARLLALSAARITAESVHSWSMICAADGFEDGDKELLRQKWGSIGRHLAAETELLTKRKDDLLTLLQNSLLDEDKEEQAIVGLGHLLGGILFDEDSDALQVIVETIIERFARDARYRRLLNQFGDWTAALLSKLLALGELFLDECSDENPEDVAILLDAAKELARRSPASIPTGFDGLLNQVLGGELQPDWHSDESAAGTLFRGRLKLLLEQDGDAFPSVDRDLLPQSTGSESSEDSDDEDKDTAAITSSSHDSAESPKGDQP